jgi:predicted PurR-regulated permease PerM
MSGQTDHPPEPTTPVLSDTRRDAAEAVTWQVRVAAAWSWRLLLVAAAIYVLVRILHRVELVAFSFVLALFLTAVLHPLERLLRRYLPGPRSVSPLLTMLIGLAVLGGIGYFVAWQITTHASELGDQISNFVTNAKQWLQTGPLHLNASDLDNIADKIKDAVSSHETELISGAVETVRTVIEILGALLVILISTFYLLRDGDTVWSWVLHRFPRASWEHVDRAAHAGWHTLGGYMLGQLLIALFHGVSVTIVLLVLRVPLAGALGVLIFLGSFIPLVGLTVTGALCVAIALLEHGLISAVVVAVAIIVLIQLEAHLLQPVIMSRSVEVHPLAVILTVIAGTTLAGIVGALLAVPFVAFANTTVRALRDKPLPAGADEPPDEPADEPG